jgi:uncharacterized protein YqeY
MDDPRPKLQTALKQAMVNKNAIRRDVIRMTLNALKQVEIDTREELSAEEALSILQKEAKKRRESIDEAEKAGRATLADQEKMELGILEEFLPKQLSRQEIEALAREAIAQTGASSVNDTGKGQGHGRAHAKSQGRRRW